MDRPVFVDAKTTGSSVCYVYKLAKMAKEINWIELPKAHCWFKESEIDYIYGVCAYLSLPLDWDDDPFKVLLGHYRDNDNEFFCVLSYCDDETVSDKYTQLFLFNRFDIGNFYGLPVKNPVVINCLFWNALPSCGFWENDDSSNKKYIVDKLAVIKNCAYQSAMANVIHAALNCFHADDDDN